jgi:predicted Zn finger-like uncharacterized protein
MLFTRCPECDTTFRVTDEALQKASGQVRCGRCASVFNAYAELHDPTAQTFEPQPPPRPPADAPRERALPARSAPTPAPSTALEEVGPATAEADANADRAVAAIVAQVEAGSAAAAAAADDERLGSDADLISAKQIDQVLTTNVGAGLPQGAPSWPTLGTEPEHRQTSRWWGVAAALALLVLIGQGLNHFRSDIAGHPTFGPWILEAYNLLGTELTPSWDVHQYEILDWVATAEPNSRGLGSLKITARIQNHGPLRQPYPAVQLRLKDRWEAAVSSRMFTPAEYLPRDTPRGRLMSPGETARAEIEVVDPGPDAYGFELDVCIEVEASLVTCGADEVFL